MLRVHDQREVRSVRLQRPGRDQANRFPGFTQVHRFRPLQELQIDKTHLASSLLSALSARRPLSNSSDTIEKAELASTAHCSSRRTASASHT